MRDDSAHLIADLPSAIGRYSLVGLLGRGGMGRVVRGHDPVLKRDVAIKLVESQQTSVDRLAEVRFMFHREARSVAALRHPNIVEIFDYSGPNAELMYIAYELIDAPTLGDVLDRQGGISIRAATSLVYELCGALQHAHNLGLVHRDVKPDNVFWRDDGRIILSDFGIAKDTSGDGDDTLRFGHTGIYGSPAYIDPARLLGRPASPQGDLYGLGVIYYECLTGQPAFAGDDVESVMTLVETGKYTPIEDLVNVPPAISTVIKRMMHLSIEGRPGSADEVAEVLREALDTLEVGDPRRVLRARLDKTNSATQRSSSTAGVVVDQAAEAANLGVDVDDESQDDETVATIFEPATRSGIRVRAPRSTWGQLLTKGPVALGMIGFAIALASGGHLLKQSFDEAKVEDVGPTTSLELGDAPTTQEANSVFVSVRFDGRQSVWVDGRQIGIFSDAVRFMLMPGPHEIAVGEGVDAPKKRVQILPGTAPEFDF